MGLINELTESTKKKYKQYNENREDEKAIYKMAYEKQKYKEIKKRAREDAKAGGTIGKLTKNLSAFGQSQYTQQKKQKKKGNYQFDMWDLGF